jgi:hypothetical protein
MNQRTHAHLTSYKLLILISIHAPLSRSPARIAWSDAVCLSGNDFSHRQLTIAVGFHRPSVVDISARKTTT